MALPLTTPLSSPPEVQWRWPNLLSNEMYIFFCKYNDPLYVKVEKLDIMVWLTNDNNIDVLLSKLKEYASEVNVDFVCKSIKAIRQTAISIESSAECCVSVLLDLISICISYVVQEAVIIMKYPLTYEGVILTLCANLEELNEPEAKASLIWIIGKYAKIINNVDELLKSYQVPQIIFLSVQLQMLTAVVKLFLEKPDSLQGVVLWVLNMAIKD
ncbi:AP-1 complex subunit beta [Scleroderma yunnanense]